MAPLSWIAIFLLYVDLQHEFFEFNELLLSQNAMPDIVRIIEHDPLLYDAKRNLNMTVIFHRDHRKSYGLISSVIKPLCFSVEVLTSCF